MKIHFPKVIFMLFNQPFLFFSHSLLFHLGNRSSSKAYLQWFELSWNTFVLLSETQENPRRNVFLRGAKAGLLREKQKAINEGGTFSSQYLLVASVCKFLPPPHLFPSLCSQLHCDGGHRSTFLRVFFLGYFKIPGQPYRALFHFFSMSFGWVKLNETCLYCLLHCPCPTDNMRGFIL